MFFWGLPVSAPGCRARVCVCSCEPLIHSRLGHLRTEGAGRGLFLALMLPGADSLLPPGAAMTLHAPGHVPIA